MVAVPSVVPTYNLYALLLTSFFDFEWSHPWSIVKANAVILILFSMNNHIFFPTHFPEVNLLSTLKRLKIKIKRSSCEKSLCKNSMNSVSGIDLEIPILYIILSKPSQTMGLAAIWYIECDMKVERVSTTNLEIIMGLIFWKSISFNSILLIIITRRKSITNITSNMTSLFVNDKT